MELRQFLDGKKIDRFFVIVLTVLLVSLIPSFAIIFNPSEPFYLPICRPIQETSSPQITIEIPLRSEFSGSFMGDVRQKMTIFDAPFSLNDNGSNYMICLKPDQIRKIQLPTRLNIAFSPNGNLLFSQEPSGFWLDLKLEKNREIEFSLFFLTPEGQNICQDRWRSLPKEAPILTSNEMRKENPFFSLMDAKFYGSDLFAEKYGDSMSRQLVEINTAGFCELFQVTSKDWLVFKEGRWQIAPSWNESDLCPVAQIRQIQSDCLEFEGFDGSIGFRFKLPLISNLPLKLKTDELFTRLRVRSEKQISCMIEKQCFILRPDDWVLKSNGRWKILRKMEEKQSGICHRPKA